MLMVFICMMILPLSPAPMDLTHLNGTLGLWWRSSLNVDGRERGSEGRAPMLADRRTQQGHSQRMPNKNLDV